jgi:hypothetical protein
MFGYDLESGLTMSGGVPYDPVQVPLDFSRAETSANSGFSLSGFFDSLSDTVTSLGSGVQKLASNPTLQSAASTLVALNQKKANSTASKQVASPGASSGDSFSTLQKVALFGVGALVVILVVRMASK